MPIWPINGGEALGCKLSIEAQYPLRHLVDKVPFTYAAEALAAGAS